MFPATTPHIDEREQLRSIVTEVLDLEPGELTENSDFVEEHEADSLLAIEILARIERDLGVFIPQDALPEMTNLCSVWAIVARHAGWEDGGV
jgi:acyl carrier protein